MHKDANQNLGKIILPSGRIGSRKNLKKNSLIRITFKDKKIIPLAMVIRNNDPTQPFFAVRYRGLLGSTLLDLSDIDTIKILSPEDVITIYEKTLDEVMAEILAELKSPIENIIRKAFRSITFQKN